MSKALESRLRKIMDRLGNPDCLQTRLEAMSDDELDARIRELMILDGFNPALPHDEALAAYIAKYEAQAPADDAEGAALNRRIVGILRGNPSIVSDLFPESSYTRSSSNPFTRGTHNTRGWDFGNGG